MVVHRPLAGGYVAIDLRRIASLTEHQAGERRVLRQIAMRAEERVAMVRTGIFRGSAGSRRFGVSLMPRKRIEREVTPLEEAA